MKLISVEISNYRVLRHAAINLPDALIGIVGPNGAGKSSLVEAISWALYGQQAARSGRSEVKSAFAAATEPCEVRLVFEVRGAEHRVIRRLVGAGQRLEVELYREGNLEVVGSTETQQYIERLLGLDWRGYVTSVYARQADLDAFSGLPPAKRREHLVGMLGIDRLDRAIDRVKGDMRIDAERAMLLEKHVAGLGELESSGARLREQLQEAERKLITATGARQEADHRLADFRVKFAEHEASRDECSQLAGQRELTATEHRHLVQQLETLKVEKHALLDLAAQTAEDRLRLAELEPVRAEFKRLDKAKESVVATSRIRSELASVGTRLKGLEQRCRQAAVQVTEIRTSIEKLSAVSLQDLSKARQELDTERERYSQLSEQMKQAEKEVQKTKESLTQIASLGGEAVCSRCLRPYGNDLDQIRRHLNDELGQLELSVRRIAGEMQESRRSGESAKERAVKLEEAIERGKGLRQSLALAESEKRESESQRSMLADQLESLNRQLSDAGETEFDEARYRQVSGQMTQLEQLERKVTQADGQLKRLPVVETMLLEMARKLDAVGRRMSEFEERRKNIRFDEDAFTSARRDLENAEAAAQIAHDELMKASHLKELLMKEVQVTGERLDEMRRTQADLTVIRERRSRADGLGKMFGDLRRNLVAGIRPRLAEIGSQLLDDMTSGRYNLMELDEDYSISLFDDGQAYGIDRFSGGESDLASLCLRLAVSLALAESAGLERSLIILDEVFGSQDDSRRERIYQGLAGLKPRFPQIIAITHIEELKNRVETIIEVEPTGKGWSEVRVDGAVA